MALTDAQIAAMGFGLPVGTDLIREGDNEISKNARAAAEGIVDAQFKKTLVPANVDIREWLKTVNKAGQYYVQSTTEVVLQTGLPQEIMSDPTLYTVLVSTLNTGISIKLTTFNVWGLEEYTCSSAPVSAGWTEWKKTKWVGKEDLAIPGAKYGYKTAALALTTPGSSTETVTALSCRLPFEYSTGFGRFRVHIRNFSDRNNAPYPGVVNFTGLWFGAGNKSTGSFNAPPQQLSTGFSLPADASDYVTPWFNAEVKAGTSYLLSAGISANSVTAVQSITAGYRFNGSSGHGATQTVTWNRTTSLPFDWWIEAEVPAETPIVAELGSSSSVGSKATYPVLESPLSLYCMRVGALPMHYAHSGTTLATWDDQTLNKWQKYQDCARPDALVLSLGSNDLFGTRTIAEIKESAVSIVGIIRAMATDNIYATTIEPRTVGDETKRRQYNSWLKTKPLGIRDVFERAASISNDDETIRPEYDADGIHTNTAGNLAKANAFTRPMTHDEMADKSDVGHTHPQVENGSGVARINASGGLQHLVNGAVVTEFNSLGELVKGNVGKIGRLTKEMRFDALGRLQYFDTDTSKILFQISPNGQITIGEVPWARVVGAPTTTAWSSITGIPEGLNASDTDSPLGPLTALLSHANTRTVPLFFIGSSTTGRVAYPTGVTKRLAAAYPSGGAEYGTVYARNPLTATHTGPGVAGYNGGIGGTTSADYLTTDVLNNIALTQPIAVFHGIGSNDWANNVNPATYEANVRAAIASIDAVITKPHVHILMQQHTRIGSRTYAWDEYGAAMRRIAADADNRVYIDLGPAIDTLDPLGADPFGFGEGDGIHLNAVGEDVLGELMTRALGVPGGAGRRGYTIDQSVGRVVKIWDYLNNREQVIYNDSGARNVTAIASFITSGQAFFRIKAGWCTLTFQDVMFDYEGTILNIFPSSSSPIESVSPLAAMGQGFLMPSNGGQAYRLSALGGGRVAAYGGVPNGLPMSGSVMWPMDRPMPSVLPGTASGSVPA